MAHYDCGRCSATLSHEDHDKGCPLDEKYVGQIPCICGWYDGEHTSDCPKGNKQKVLSLSDLPTMPHPKTLEEAGDAIAIRLDPASQATLIHDGPNTFHHGLGQNIRNLWLWDTKENPKVLATHFRKRFGLGQADDMSSLILNYVYHKIRGTPSDLLIDVDNFKRFWKQMDVDPLTLEPLKKEKPKAIKPEKASPAHYYEVHITVDEFPVDKEWVKSQFELLGWKFSCIDGDPVLGAGIKMYATKQFNGKHKKEDIMAVLSYTAEFLENNLEMNVVRTKIEDVIFDSKSNKIQF